MISVRSARYFAVRQTAQERAKCALNQIYPGDLGTLHWCWAWGWSRSMPEESCTACSHIAAEDGGLCWTPIWQPPPPHLWCWCPGRCPQSSPIQSFYEGSNMKSVYIWIERLFAPDKTIFAAHHKLASRCGWCCCHPEEVGDHLSLRPIKLWVSFCKLLQYSTRLLTPLHHSLFSWKYYLLCAAFQCDWFTTVGYDPKTLLEIV